MGRPRSVPSVGQLAQVAGLMRQAYESRDPALALQAERRIHPLDYSLLDYLEEAGLTWRQWMELRNSEHQARAA